MYCIYLIQHNESKRFYIGKTNNLSRRIKEHNSGQQKSTKRKSGEWILIYAEAYRNKTDADKRELKLKENGSAKFRVMQRIEFSKI